MAVSPRRTRPLSAAVVAALLLAASLSLSPITPAEAAFPGTNGKIAFVSFRDGNYEIYTMNANGTGQTRLTNNAAFDLDPAWSPDGTRIAFRSTRSGNSDIYVMNADGSSPIRLTTDLASDLEPAWSPDGMRIAFQSARDGNDEIYVMNANGTDQTRLTNDGALDRQPAWSPDGGRIAFYSARDGNDEIYVMTPYGSVPTRLTSDGALDRQPAWSPDRGRIAFYSDRDGNDEIYIMNANGTGESRLTTDPGFDETPNWSPDGTQIAFWSDRDGNAEIYVMNADGSNPTNLSNNANIDFAPDWQRIPPGAQIAVTVRSFEGTSELDTCALGQCFRPPATMGAAGTDQFMETSNGSIAVYDKESGALLAPRIGMNAFWTSAGAPPTPVGGSQRVLFDHYSSRWIVVGFGSTFSDIYIAVSDTADALGSWQFTSILGVAGIGPGAVADSPTLGMDDTAVYIATNNFLTSPFFSGTSLFSIPKADLFGLAPTTTSRTRFDTASSAPDIGYVIQGATNWGGNPTATASVLAASAAVNAQYFYQLSGVGAPGATRTASMLIADAPYDLPLPARQPDGTRLVDAGFDTIVNPVYQANGRLYSVRTLRPLGFDYDVVRWTVLDASTGALIEEGDIAAEVGFDYYQGSIAANESGEVVIGYNRSGGADKGLAGRISFMARTFVTNAAGGLDQLGPDILLRVSDVSDYRCGSRLTIETNCRQRWGPTSGVTVDPLDEHRFFAIGQYAADWAITPLDVTERAIWHTYIADISFAPDTDGDGFADPADNCTLVANPTQLDADSDGYGNICDADLNNSGLVTTADFGILRSVLNQSAGSSANAANADLNGSGTVTTADFAILRARLNTAPGPSGLHP